MVKIEGMAFILICVSMLALGALITKMFFIPTEYKLVVAESNKYYCEQSLQFYKKEYHRWKNISYAWEDLYYDCAGTKETDYWIEYGKM